MSRETKPVNGRPQAKTSSGKPEVVTTPRPKKQPSEMLERWKVESRNDVPFTEKIYVNSQDHGQASKH